MQGSRDPTVHAESRLVGHHANEAASTIEIANHRGRPLENHNLFRSVHVPRFPPIKHTVSIEKCNGGVLDSGAGRSRPVTERTDPPWATLVEPLKGFVASETLIIQR